MRYALIPFVSGLVILLSPIGGAIAAPSDSLTQNNNDWQLDNSDVSDHTSLLDEEEDQLDLKRFDLDDGELDFRLLNLENDDDGDQSGTETWDSEELQNPSPQFDRPNLPVVFHPQDLDRPTKSLLSPRALISVTVNANSSTFVDAQPLAVAAAGGGKATGKSKTSGDAIGYNYLGCYTDGGGGEGHTLQGKSLIDDDDMTKELCQAFCASWPYFGMEYGKECYCGNAILNGAPDLESTCNVPCEGNTSQTCGGGGHMSIYYDSSVPGPSAPAVFNGANFIGCYVELQQVRVLDNGGVTSETAMDLTVCSNYCYNLSPTRDWWGLENAKECWCAFDINPNAVLASNPDGCGQACTGNDTQLCGGINLVAVYQRP